MRPGFLLTTSAILFAVPVRADDLVSGPQVGATIPGRFDAIAVNGPDAGEECCPFCRYGNAPVVMVFAPKPSAELAMLVKAIEAASAAVDPAAEVGICAVVTDTSPAVRKQLRKLAADANLKRAILAVVEPEKVKDSPSAGTRRPRCCCTASGWSGRTSRSSRASWTRRGSRR